MKKQDKILLEILLINWFNENNNNKHKWSREKVGSIIRKELQKLGNWKNSPRGNPRLGGKIKTLNKIKEQNPDIELRNDYDY